MTSPMQPKPEPTRQQLRDARRRAQEAQKKSDAEGGKGGGMMDKKGKKGRR